MRGASAGWASMAHRWADFITPSTLQLAPLLEVLLEPISCVEQLSALQLGLQEVLVNAVRHGNANDPGKCLRIRRIVTPRWWVFQVQDQGCGLPLEDRSVHLPDQADALCGRGLFLIDACFDDVRWSARGNRVQVALRR
ncbi:ATP-binding protein [Vulcanococcus sp.]|uniref:ATP-binding protein n=1 Tax=Vulcanococcus sp. TaxID=2856995 RepID=UPI003F69850E